jgi:hypothetical protein
VAATADGRRLVASVANPTATLWSVPILDRVIEERDVKPYPVGPSRALGPRFGKGPVFFLSSSGAKDGLWSYADGKALEIWKGVDGELSAPAAVSPDGDQVAVAPIRNGRRNAHHRLRQGRQPPHALGPRRRARRFGVVTRRQLDRDRRQRRPGPGAVPRSRGRRHAAPDRERARLRSGVVADRRSDSVPGSAARGRAVTRRAPSDRSAVEFPQISIPFGGGGRVRFLPDGRGIIYIQGSLGEQDFWLMDSCDEDTASAHQAGQSGGDVHVRSHSGRRQIVFDRLRENSDLRLIDLR